MRQKILGLVGATGSGKTTLARRLVRDHGFVHFHMGQPLKDMLGVLGLPEADVAGSSEQRAQPQAILGGKSIRYALSTLGTEWGRNMITPDLWANALGARIQRHFRSSSGLKPIVIDDLRFPNDWAVVQQFDGVILTVRRPAVETRRTAFDHIYHALRLSRLFPSRTILGKRPIHETEFYWPDAPSAAEIWNTSTIDDLVSAALAHWR